MKVQEKAAPKCHINIIELLVQEEIERQAKHYSPSLVKYINKVEVATYALNRLPALYASSEKGKQQQKLLAQKQYKERIETAVRQGFAAVQRDPLRLSTPLVSDAKAEYHVATTALHDLQNLLEARNLLGYQDLSWENLVNTVQRALNRAAAEAISQQAIKQSSGKETTWDSSLYSL